MNMEEPTNKGLDAGVTPDTSWMRVFDPREAHRAAHYAWLHLPTGCIVVALWFADDDRLGEGHIKLMAIHPNGWRSDLVSPGPDLNRRMDWEIAELVARVDRAQGC